MPQVSGHRPPRIEEMWPEMKIPLEDRSSLILHNFYKFIGEVQEAGRWGLNKDKNSHIKSTNPFADRTSSGC